MTYRTVLFCCVITFVVMVLVDSGYQLEHDKPVLAWMHSLTGVVSFISASITGGIALAWTTTWESKLEERTETWVHNWKWPDRFKRWMSGG